MYSGFIWGSTTLSPSRSLIDVAAWKTDLTHEVNISIEREIARWARSYLAAKNHRLNEVPRERLLDLVARHLDSAPAYYLWRNPCP
jgi:hypothetical protein